MDIITASAMFGLAIPSAFMSAFDLICIKPRLFGRLEIRQSSAFNFLLNNCINKSRDHIISVKSRTRAFVILTTLFVIGLVLFAPAMFDFREVFQVGRFTEVESSNIEYTDGTGGIQVILYIEYIELEYHFIRTTIKPTSSEDVVTNGLLALNHMYNPPGWS